MKRDANGGFTDQEESGFDGVKVRVIDASGNAVSFQDASGKDLDYVTTDAKGLFFIYGLGNGHYKLQFDYQDNSALTQLDLSPANVFEASLGAEKSDSKDSDGVTELAPGLVETEFFTAGSNAATKVKLGLAPAGSVGGGPNW